MKYIKEYEHVNPKEENISFRIERMETIYDKRSGTTDDLHRHNFFTVLIVKEAEGFHVIDFNKYELSTHQTFFLSPGQVHQIIEKQRSLGYVLAFSFDFLALNNIPLCFLNDLQLFRDYGDSPPIKLSECVYKELNKYCEDIESYYDSDAKFKEHAIAALLQLLLIRCNNIEIENNHPQTIEAGNTLLREFKALVEQHYKEWHATSQYATRLNITPDHLNRTVKSLIGKTAKEYIQSRITVAAKRMLYFSEFSAKEVGYDLGFSEPSHFSQFFKKCVGISPSQFKNKKM